MTSEKSVNCPTCFKKVTWVAANTYRPFCSERCKLLDLGDWANDKFVIPGEPVSIHQDELPDSDPEDYPG